MILITVDAVRDLELAGSVSFLKGKYKVESRALKLDLHELWTKLSVSVQCKIVYFLLFYGLVCP